MVRPSRQHSESRRHSGSNRLILETPLRNWTKIMTEMWCNSLQSRRYSETNRMILEVRSKNKTTIVAEMWYNLMQWSLVTLIENWSMPTSCLSVEPGSRFVSPTSHHKNRCDYRSKERYNCWQYYLCSCMLQHYHKSIQYHSPFQSKSNWFRCRILRIL